MSAAGSHPRDAVATCPACGTVCPQRYDATQIVDHNGALAQADQTTCSRCKQTYSANITYRPDLTEDDLLKIIERRTPNATELRTRIAIEDMWAESARLKGDFAESSTRAREAFRLRRELGKIERLAFMTVDEAQRELAPKESP